jgi:hypothetical protein
MDRFPVSLAPLTFNDLAEPNIAAPRAMMAPGAIDDNDRQSEQSTTARPMSGTRASAVRG